MCDDTSTTSPLVVASPVAVILAGGKGMRLRTVVRDRPKPMAEVNGRPFLELVVGILRESVIRRVVICIGYMGDAIRTHFGDGKAWGVEIAYSEDADLGTGGALRKALPLMNSDTALVLNGDSYCGVNLGTFLTWHLARKADASIVLTQVQDCGRYGQVCFDDDCRITQFAEKRGGDGPGWVNAGIYLLARELIATIPLEIPVSLERDVFAKLVGKNVFGYPSRGRFLDIGTPESYRQANGFFAERTVHSLEK